MKIFIPDNIDVNKDILRYCPELKKHPNLHAQKVQYFIHYLYTQPRMKKRREHEGTNKLVQIHNGKLRNIFGRRYSRQLKKLLLEYCEFNPHYSNWEGEAFTQSYMLKPEYYYHILKVIEITDETLIKNINRKPVEKTNSLDEIGYVLQEKLQQLELNQQEAIKYIKSDECEKFIRKKTKDKTKIIDKQNSRIILTYMWNNSNSRSTMCEKAKRFHSILTNLASDLRQFLRYNNSILINLDICNSQPFLLGLATLDYLLRASSVDIGSADQKIASLLSGCCSGN